MVARAVRDRKVMGSNPITPTSFAGPKMRRQATPLDLKCVDEQFR